MFAAAAAGEAALPALAREAPFGAARDAAWWTQRSIAVDTVMLAASVVVAAALSTHPLSILWTVAFALSVAAAFVAKGLYREPLQVRLIDTAGAVIVTTSLAAAVAIAGRSLVANSPAVAEQGLRLWLVATVLLVTGRVALGFSDVRARRIGDGGSRTLIVGAGETARRVAKRLEENHAFGLKPIGFLDKEPLASDDAGQHLPVLGASWDFERILDEHGVEHVLFTFSRAPTDVFLGLLKRCHELGVRTSVVPRLYERLPTATTVESLGGVPLVVNHLRDPRGWQFGVKYALDRLGAAVMLVVASPVLAVLSLAVWASLGRPILYRQERVGRDGTRFDMLKFRSMRPPTDGEAGTPVQLAGDTAPGGVEGADRRTRVGAIMRHLSLDELPQLINVLKGDMSFIGPRPERPEFVDVFERSVHRYDERHRVKSGITGWAQVNGLRGKTSIADRVEWDNHYIENWSAWFDLKILLLTFVAVLRAARIE